MIGGVNIFGVLSDDCYEKIDDQQDFKLINWFKSTDSVYS